MNFRKVSTTNQTKPTHEPTQTPPNCLYKGLLRSVQDSQQGTTVVPRGRLCERWAVGDVRCAGAMCDRVGCASGGRCASGDRCAGVMCAWSIRGRCARGRRYWFAHRSGERDARSGGLRDAVRGRCTGCDARTSADWLHLRDAVRCRCTGCDAHVGEDSLVWFAHRSGGY